MPCRAIMKFNVRYGCMLLCGRLPPATFRAFGAMVAFWVVEYNGGGVRPTLDAAQTAFVGSVCVAAVIVPRS